MVLVVGQAHQLTSDGQARFDALHLLLDRGRLSANQYSLIGPLFATPLWIGGKLVGGVEGWLRQYNLVILVLGLGLTVLLLRGRVDSALLRRFLLLVVAGSMVAPHVTDFYGEVFTAIGVGVGLLAAVVRTASPATRVAGWVAAVLGAANTPASLVGLGLAGAAEATRHRRLRYALPVGCAVLLVLGEAWLRRGDPFDNGYAGTITIARTVMPYSGHDGFSYPFFFGVLAILFSFGKGIVWFLPGLLLPARSRLRDLTLDSTVDLWRVWTLWTAFLAGLVLAYASWWAWYGGMYWGPRFFLVGILPASLALAAWICSPRSTPLGNLAALVVLTLSVWIGANSLAFGELWASPCFDNNYEKEALCHFTLEFSALWYPFVVKPSLSTGQVLALCYYALVLLCLAAPVVRRLVGPLRLPTLARPGSWRW